MKTNTPQQYQKPHNPDLEEGDPYGPDEYEIEREEGEPCDPDDYDTEREEGEPCDPEDDA